MSAVVTATLLPSPAPRRHEEDDLQRACCDFLTVALPPDAVAHLPGEGKGHDAPRGVETVRLCEGLADIEIIFRGRSIFID
jgi:hypothetical protein